MIKKILAVTLTTFLIAACGGSSSNGGGNNGNGGDGGGGGGGVNPDAGGQSGSFGDSAAAENGIDGTFPICASSLQGSFTGWIKDGTSWCIWKCPDNQTVENADGDVFGSISRGDGLAPWTCLITTATGSASAPMFAPIGGCPEGPCRSGIDFPRVYVSRDAGTDLAGSYTCTAWEFDTNDQRWATVPGQAAFDITLNEDFTTGGNSTTWSFANGVLTLEGQRTFNNVAVGSGTFSSYQSNTALIRCE